MSDSARTITRRGFAAASAGALVGFASPPDAAAQDAGDTLRSEFLVDLVFDVGTPLNLGTRQIVPVTGGTFSGPKLKGTALTGGGDWTMSSSSTSRTMASCMCRPERQPPIDTGE